MGREVGNVALGFRKGMWLVEFTAKELQRYRLQSERASHALVTTVVAQWSTHSSIGRTNIL